MQSETVRLLHGHQLHHVEQGRVDGEVMLFLHGWPDSWYTFSTVLARMPVNLRCIALDQRGFGESDRPERGYGIEDLAEDVVAFLDALAIEQATIVGHSLGSFVARRVAIKNPDRVRGLALIGTGLSPLTPVLQEAQRAVATLEDPLPFDFVREFQSGTTYGPVPEGFMAGVIAESLKAPAHVWRDVIAGLLAYDDVEDLAKISAPSLLIWGEKEVIFQNREDQERLAAMIPNAILRVYADTGHCPNWERPEDVAVDLVAFQFDRLRAERAGLAV